jgi:hypothetical protein
MIFYAFEIYSICTISSWKTSKNFKTNFPNIFSYDKKQVTYTTFFNNRRSKKAANSEALVLVGQSRVSQIVWLPLLRFAGMFN